MIFIVLGGSVLKIWPLLGGLSFHDSLFVPPPIFRIAAMRKQNGAEILTSQNFLVSMISTSILNKKKNPWHRVYIPVWVELEWPSKTNLNPSNDPSEYLVQTFRCKDVKL